MNKRQEANMRVKARITAALLTLLNEKSISDITVTEIISEAGVARASFYRNYCSRRWNWSAAFLHPNRHRAAFSNCGILFLSGAMTPSYISP